MKFLKRTKKMQMRLQQGIFCSQIHSNTTLEVSKFYSNAPFPNYQGYEKFSLSQIVSENEFLKDLKDYIGFNKTFMRLRVEQQMSIGWQLALTCN